MKIRDFHTGEFALSDDTLSSESANIPVGGNHGGIYMNLSVCIDAVYSQTPPELAIGLVKEAGIRAVEFWSWRGKDIDAIDRARQTLDMEIAAFCTTPSNLVDEEARDSFLQGLQESISVAKRLACRTLIATVGNELPAVTRETQHRNIVEGLRQAVPLLERHEITLVIEPLNTHKDHPGYFLSSSEEAYEIVTEVNSPSVKILFDFYHQHITEGNLIAQSLRILPQIGHFHCAGNAGRHELRQGEIDYPAIFKALAHAGYRGYAGLEYFPSSEPEIGLREAAELLTQR